MVKLILPKKERDFKKILFVEPIKQGYGDLFFQTSLFCLLKKSGYKIHILTNKNHSQILENNPDVEKVLFWNIKTFFKLLKQRFILIGLGRDTLRETFLVLFLYRSNPILLDKDVEKWKLIFENHSNTIAWNIIASEYLKIKLEKPKPKIYFSEKESSIINSHKSRNRIGVIYGVQNKDKIFEKIDDVVEMIPENKKIILLGKGENKILLHKNKNIEDYVNKISYRETLVKIATCETVAGTEGSLIQIASSIVPKTIVLDINNTFTKNCHPEFIKNTNIFNRRTRLDPELFV